MESRCRCGNPIVHAFDELGCIECGQACCPACGVSLESVTYCARCARAFLEFPCGSPGAGPRKGEEGTAMRRSRRVCVELSVLVAAPFAILVALARAQTLVAPSPEGAAPAGGMTGGMFVVALMMALLIIGVATKVLDRARERSDEAVTLQSRIADALEVDPALGHLPVTVTAYAPLWRSSPVTIEIRGQVPTRELQKAAINLVLQEACGRVGAQFRVEDGIIVVPSMRRAA